MLYEIVNIYQYIRVLVDIVHNIVLVPFADAHAPARPAIQARGSQGEASRPLARADAPRRLSIWTTAWCTQSPTPLEQPHLLGLKMTPGTT